MKLDKACSNADLIHWTICSTGKKDTLGKKEQEKQHHDTINFKTLPFLNLKSNNKFIKEQYTSTFTKTNRHYIEQLLIE